MAACSAGCTGHGIVALYTRRLQALSILIPQQGLVGTQVVQIIPRKNSALVTI
jgi:hypothetical protein